jgi:hypothetical protein
VDVVGLDTSCSNDYCIYTRKRVITWCYHSGQEILEGHGSRAWCNGCYNPLEQTTISRNTTSVLLMYSNEEDTRIEEFQVLNEYVLNKFYWGSEKNASQSEHECLNSRRKEHSGCYHKSTDVDNGIAKEFLCSRDERLQNLDPQGLLSIAIMCFT